MKSFKITMVALLLSTVFISCKKENTGMPAGILSGTTQTESKDITGIWIGEYITTTRSPAVYFSFKIKAGGALDLLNEDHEVIGKGSWKLAGSKFTAEYIINGIQLLHSVKGEYSNTEKNISGEWQYDQPYEDTGFWFMDKVN